MIKALLFAGAASVAVAQLCSDNKDSAACTGVATCTWTPGTCYRSKEACTTNATATGCSNTTYLDSKTCTNMSMAADTLCGGKTDNTSCTTNSQCSFNPGTCSNMTMVNPCSTKMDSTGCTGQAGCFWFSIQPWTCGIQGTAVQKCVPCEGVLDNATRSALINLKSQTCTWPAMDSFAQPFKAVVTDAAQNAGCPAPLAPSADDATTLSTNAAAKVFLGSNSWGASSTATCMVSPTAAPTVMKNNAASLVPGLALVVVAWLM